VRTSGRCSFRWPRGYDFRCAPDGVLRPIANDRTEKTS
jgi:hypothetical protein